MLILALGVTGVGETGDCEGQLVEVAEDDASHRVAAEQLHRAKRCDTTCKPSGTV